MAAHKNRLPRHRRVMGVGQTGQSSSSLRQRYTTMIPDILIVFDSAGFHLLHGHLHLAVMLSESGKASVDVKGHGTVLISKRSTGLVVQTGEADLPLLPY